MYSHPPGVDRLGNVRVARAHGQARPRGVPARCRICQRPRQSRIVVDDELLQRRPRDGRTVRVHRDRRRDPQPRAVGRRRRVPAARHERVAAAHQEPVAGVRRGRRIVAARARVVQLAQREHPPAVVELVEDAAVALRGVDRAQNEEIGSVLHHAAGVPRRQLDVGDDGVLRRLGIDLPEDAAEKLLVRPRVTERAALESRRLHPFDVDPHDAGLGRARNGEHGRQGRAENGSAETPAGCRSHVLPPLGVWMPAESIRTSRSC